MARRRQAGTTTERGLGWSHQQERAAALAAFVPGAGCPLCGRPMWRSQRLDLDHSVPRAFGGQGPRRLAHATCNRRAGAILGNQLRGAARRGQPSRAGRRRGAAAPPDPARVPTW